MPARATRLHLVIDDDGPGIAEADRARVLVRGGRADEATPGHGIGLAMVHDTVALYGGTMQIDASPLGGARFDLKLPGRMVSGTDAAYGPSLISKVMPWASGSSRLQLMVLVWRRM